jgi:WbqC-like protein family
MRLGIMQPYFFPYLGHFALIANVDSWVVFDVTQYTPKTWISRNRVLHPSTGTNWINVPLRNSSISIKIHEAKILDLNATAQSTVGKLSHYRHRAPFYKQVEELVKATFAACGDDDSLVNLNVNGLDVVCEYLGIPFQRQICSRMNLPFPAQMGPGDWAPEICRLLGATSYLNPIGGKALFEPAKFDHIGVSLAFFSMQEFRYDTRPFEFVPNLSILDVLMWNSPETVRNAVQTCGSIDRAHAG